MPIEVACRQCNTRYRVLDTLAGKTAKCKKCSAKISIPDLPTLPEEEPKGGPIIKHEAREREFQLAIGDQDSIEAIDAHITRHIGEIEMVFHELVSDLVHIDVHWVKPTRQRPFHTLVTSGMSDLPMTTPEGAEDFRYAELMICLPPDWPMEHASWKDERHYWPIRTLKFLARFPHEYRTWLCAMHTMPNGDPAEPLASNTKLCGSILAPPVLSDAEFRRLIIDNEKEICFWAVVPIYAEEMDYKLKNGGEALFDLFDKHGINELLNVDRRNLCKKGWRLFG
jgi:hypothetical protein